MKRLLRFGIIALSTLCLVLSYAVPAMADEGSYKVITACFNVDQASTGYNIPQGSMIRHLDDDTTEVYGSSNSLVLRARDLDAHMVSTPCGFKRATYVYSIPSGSHIVEVGNTTNVYFNGTMILMVVDAHKEKQTFPIYTGWIEDSNDWSVDNLDLFGGTWVVPSNPPNPEANVVDFLFNAIENQSGNKILQPVLEWNQAGSGRWTCRAWYGSSSGYYCSSPINANAGNSIAGAMNYEGGYYGWLITCSNHTTHQSTWITTTILGTSSLAVFCALEGYNIDENDDVPGDTTFDNMAFDYNGNGVDITWVADDDIPPGSGLTGLDVEIFSDSKVKLHTAN